VNPRCSLLDFRFNIRSLRANPKLLLLLTAVFILSAGMLAQDNSTEGQRNPALGTTAAPGASSLEFQTAIAPLQGRIVYQSAQYGTGGVGLRNRSTGAIGVSGVLTPVKAAYIYWAVITNGAVKAADKTIKLQRLSPTPASAVVSVAGTLIGSGATPCWTPGTTTISVFRGAVPLTVANGNGLYQVTLLPGAGGTTAGADPWLSYTPPLFEGASLVIVGTGPAGQRVAIYDTGFAGNTFHGDSGFSYTLTLPVAATGKLTLLDNIGADGQEGVSRLAKAGNGDEQTTINSVHIAGPGSNAIDGDWNGSSGKPLPQLWDDTGHDITAATPKGTDALNVEIYITGSPATVDCMTTVANIVAVQ
jgi:hypothetical protein